MRTKPTPANVSHRRHYVSTHKFSAFALVTLVLMFFSSDGKSALANALPPENVITCVHTPGTNDKCKDPFFALKSAPNELKKEIERLGDLIAISLIKARDEEKLLIAKAKKDSELKRKALFLEKSKADSALKSCLRKYGLSTSSKNPRGYCSDEQFEALLAEQRYVEHVLWGSIGSTNGKYFNQWLSAWESLGILAKTFPQHIQPSKLPSLLTAYDNVKSCRANNSCQLP